MHYAENDFRVQVPTDRFERESRGAVHALAAQIAREASTTPSLRRRVGEAVIALGVRLAGEPKPQLRERRLRTRPT